MTVVLRGIILGVALAVSGLAPASAQEQKFVLGEFLRQQDIAGGVLLVADPDGEHLVAAGISNRESRREVSRDTRFYIASAGKMVVATAVLAYVEDGAIGLDAPVWPYIKSIKGIERLKNADLVTLRQLLNHTSGLAEYLDDKFVDATASFPSRQFSVADALSYAFDYPAQAAPGAEFEYTNTNYVLLGHILAVLGGSLTEALESKVFAPAGMDETTVGGPGGKVDLAHGYVDGEDVSAQGWASTLGDGPLVTTVGDMEKFAFALFRDGKLIGAAMLDQMLVGSALDRSYGLGMGIDGDVFGGWYGHAGSYDGFESDLRYYPKTQTLFVALLNGNVLDEDAVLLDRAAAWYFTQ